MYPAGFETGRQEKEGLILPYFYRLSRCVLGLRLPLSICACPCRPIGHLALFPLRSGQYSANIGLPDLRLLTLFGLITLLVLSKYCTLANAGLLRFHLSLSTWSLPFACFKCSAMFPIAKVLLVRTSGSTRPPQASPAVLKLEK